MSTIKDILRKNISKRTIALAIIKLIAFVFGLVICFYFAMRNQILISALGFIIMCIILSKKVTSKSEIDIIKITLKNVYFIIIYLSFIVGIIWLMMGLMFAFKDIEIIKMLLIISFSLAGITFIGVMQKEDKQDPEISNPIILSCLFFVTSGFLYLLEIGARLIEEVNPITNLPLKGYSLMKSSTPEFSILGTFLLAMGLFLMIHLLINKIKRMSPQKNKKIKDSIFEFFGLDRLAYSNF